MRDRIPRSSLGSLLSSVTPASILIHKNLWYSPVYGIISRPLTVFSKLEFAYREREMVYPEKCTSLMVAAMVGAVAHTRQLLDQGADPNVALPNCGSRALHWLAWRPLPNESDRADVARLLVEAGADINARIFSGLDDEPIVDQGNVYLAEHGSATVLHTAAAAGAVDLVRVLLELGADPMLRTRSVLITRPDPSEAGARWEYRAVDPGSTALELAERAGLTAVADVLRGT